MDPVRDGAVHGVPARVVAVDLDGVTVRLWRATELERFVDAEGLLRADVPPEPPYWMHLWPGALVVARWVAATPRVGPTARVLELGCGLALPAIAAARRGAAVVASDWHAAPLRFAQRSAALNGCRIDCVQMDWAAPALRSRFDVCIGADVAYDRAGARVLVATIREWVTPGGTVYLADSVNTARRELAEHLRGSGFEVTVSEVREIEDGHVIWVRVIEARRQ